MSLAALVLAAGRGQRLRPLTDSTPKPLLPLGCTTLLDAALARVASVVPLDPTTVAVNAHWLAEQIVAHVGETVHVSVEQPEALGTAGAVGQLRAWLAGRDVLIANSDACFAPEPDLSEFVAGWDRSRPRLLVVADPDRPDFPGGRRFAGVSLLPGDVAARLPAVPSGLYEAVWRGVELDLVDTDVTFLDCGTIPDYERAQLMVERAAGPA